MLPLSVSASRRSARSVAKIRLPLTLSKSSAPSAPAISTLPLAVSISALSASPASSIAPESVEISTLAHVPSTTPALPLVVSISTSGQFAHITRASPLSVESSIFCASALT